MDPIRTTTDVIVPATVGLGGMIVLPAAVVWGIKQFVNMFIPNDFLCK